MSKKQDIQIIQSLKTDVRGSYTVIYEEHYGMIRHLITSNSGSEEDAADVFQDSVIALFEMVKKKEFTLSSKLSTMIYSIARNQWLKKLRDSNKSDKIKDSEKFIDLNTTYDQEKEEKIVRMEDAIAVMGDPCKSILIGFYYLKKKMQEIAEDLNYKSSDQAKTQKYKCLQRLKKIMVS